MLPLYGVVLSRADISPVRCTVMGVQSPNELLTVTASRRCKTPSRIGVGG